MNLALPLSSHSISKIFLLLAIPCFAAPELTYPIVDTGVTDFYSDKAVMDKPAPGEPFFGQDAHYRINPPSYTDNKDGTITDNVTGLIWQKTMAPKMTFDEAKDKAGRLEIGGRGDWRVPTIKELYSLIQFTGTLQRRNSRLYIDTEYFDQPLGDTRKGEREIDAQTWSSTEYTGKTMRNDDTVFGVNFIDGRNPYDSAAYIAFGEAQGKMHGRVMDVHGAGAQRSDPKSGTARDYPQYFGPQGDIRYVFNYARCVRGSLQTGKDSRKMETSR